MKNKLLKTLTPLVLVVLLIATLTSVFVLTAGADAGTEETTGTTQSFVKVTATPTDWSGEYLIVYETGSVAFDGSLTTLDAVQNTVSVTISNSEIEYTNVLANSTFTINADGNIQSKSGYYIGNTSNSNALSSSTTTAYTNTISIDANGNLEIKSSGGAYLRYNSASNQLRFRYYKSSSYASQQAITLYKLVKTGGGETTCEHTNTENVAEVPATCTTPGTRAGTKCADCGEVQSGCETIDALGHDKINHDAQTATCTQVGWDAYVTCSRCDYTTYAEIPMLDHTYENGECTVCGAEEPITVEFDYREGTNGEAAADVANYKGVSLVFSKGNNSSGNIPKWYSSGTAIRFYTGNTLTVSSTDSDYYIKNVTFTFTQGAFSVASGSISDCKWTATDGEKTDSVVFTNESSTQARVSYIIVELALKCTHENTEEIGESKEATCTEAGITAGLKCTDCDKIIEERTVIPATGHKDENGDSVCDDCGTTICTEHDWTLTSSTATCTEDGSALYTCSACGETKTELKAATGHTEVVDPAVDATCTSTGLTEGKHCSVCDEVLVSQTETPKAAHTFGSDDKCTNCGLVRYAKVNDVTTLKDGDVIVIYYPSGNLLLSGTASGTKLEGVGATLSDNYIYADNADALALTVRIDESGNYYFETADDKYLTGTGSNNLTLGETLSDSAKWSFNTEGTTATLRIVNKNNGLALEYYNGLFTVYKIGDTAAYNFEIYSYAVPKITNIGASLNTGVTIRVIYDIPEAWLTANSGAKVVFTCEGETKEFDAVSGLNTYYVNLASHLISKAITVQIVDGEGNALTASEGVSLSIYRAKLEAADLKTLKMTANQKEKALALIDAALIHSDYASGALTKDIELTDEEFVASGVVKNFDGTITVKANLSAKIKLIIGITSETAPTVTVDGQAVECDFTNNVLTIGGLYHTKFNDEIVISVGETEVLKFTFNSYLKAIYSSGASDKNLAAATYLYGVAAEAYISAE